MTMTVELLLGMVIGLVIGVIISLISIMTGFTIFARFAVKPQDDKQKDDDDWWKNGEPAP